MELGLYTFADVNPEPAEGQRGVEGAQRVKNLLEEIELADQVGLDVFGLARTTPPPHPPCCWPPPPPERRISA